jgi:hypothetical protein
MATFRIINEQEIRSTDPASVTGFDTLVTYTDAAGRINAVIVPAKDPTDAEITAAVKDHQERGQRRMGREITT